MTTGLPTLGVMLGMMGVPAASGCVGFMEDETPCSWVFSRKFLVFGPHYNRDSRHLVVQWPYPMLGVHETGDTWQLRVVAPLEAEIPGSWWLR